MWCMAELTPEYIQRMENVLRLYRKPWNSKEPVVCLDEKSVQLLEDSRPVKPVRPGQVEKQDSEYICRGTGNIFCGVEPKAGRHFTWKIARAYPRVKTRHLVMDNLNTHNEKSLVDYYGPRKGRQLWKLFTVHDTPKHGSWLNQAEIEIGIFSRQCLDKDRIATLKALKDRAHAWNRRINKKRVKIDWTFTTAKARKTFGYKDKN